jgi:VCBS repeat-containing protein
MVTAPAGSGVVATASGTVKIQGVKKRIKLATAIVTLQAGQTGQLNLKPKGNKAAVRAAFKQINAALAQGKKVTAALTIEIVDDAGNSRVVKRTVELTKSRAKP